MEEELISQQAEIHKFSRIVKVASMWGLKLVIPSELPQTDP